MSGFQKALQDLQEASVKQCQLSGRAKKTAKGICDPTSATLVDRVAWKCNQLAFMS